MGKALLPRLRGEHLVLVRQEGALVERLQLVLLERVDGPRGLLDVVDHFHHRD